MVPSNNPNKNRIFKQAGLWLLSTQSSLYYFPSFEEAKEFLYYGFLTRKGYLTMD